jgi:transcriptional regulator with XRE-family HTH domain
MIRRTYQSHNSELRRVAGLKGYTLKALAMMSGTSYRQVIRYNQGDRPLDPYTGAAMARVLDVHPRTVDPDLPAKMRSQINATEERVAFIRGLIADHEKTLEKLEAKLSRDLAIFSQFLEES